MRNTMFVLFWFSVFKCLFNSNTATIGLIFILTDKLVNSDVIDMNLKDISYPYKMKASDVCENKNMSLIVEDISILYPSRCGKLSHFVDWTDASQKQLLINVRDKCNGQNKCLFYDDMLTGINTNCQGNSDKPEKLEIIYTCYAIIPDGQRTFDMAANFKITKTFQLDEIFYFTLQPNEETFATFCLVESDNLNVLVDVLSTNHSPKISCQEKTQTINDTKSFSNIECYRAKTMRFNVSTNRFTFIKLTVRRSGNISLSCARGEKDITTTEASITDVVVESNPTTIIVTSTSKPTFATTKTNVWSTRTTEKGLTSDTTKSRSSDSVKGDDEEEKSSKIALICAVSAGAVFVIIIIVISAVCIRKRCTNRQRTLPAIIPPKAHYKSEDEYAIIDATSSYENANSNELSGPTTTVPLRDNTNADEDSDAFGDYSTIPKTDEQYTEISSIPGAFAGTAESEGKTKSMRKGSNSVSCSQQPSLQPTAFVACEGTDQKYTNMADAPSAVYSTPNKLKKNSIRAPNPASDPPPAANSASDPAPESNDVYSHLSHYIQNKPETENVYNG